MDQRTQNLAVYVHKFVSKLHSNIHLMKSSPDRGGIIVCHEREHTDSKSEV